MTRLLIVDDQPRARRSLKALLTVIGWSTPGGTEQSGAPGLPCVEIVGEAQNGQEAIEQAALLVPDVVVMDLQLHAVSSPGLGLTGVETIRRIKGQWPAIRILVLTMFATDRAAVVAAGADAFLLKGCPVTELLEAVMGSDSTTVS